MGPSEGGPSKRAQAGGMWTAGPTGTQASLAQMECGVSCSQGDKGQGRPVLPAFTSLPRQSVLLPCAQNWLSVCLAGGHFQNSETALEVSDDKHGFVSIALAQAALMAGQCWTWDPHRDLLPEALPLGKLPAL